MMAQVITVIGGSGFIGRYLVKHLASEGWCVRIAVRDPVRAEFLRPCGAVGQIVPIQCNIRYADSIRAAVTGATCVVNLTGILYERGRQRFQSIQAEGPGLVAQAAREAGCEQLIHVSAIGADINSISAYARSKAAGEQAVYQAFPAATIIRPSIVFGAEDGFFNRFAALTSLSPLLPLIGGGKTRLQPVYVMDVARAIAIALRNPVCAGQIFELGGPNIYSFEALMIYLLKIIERRRLLLTIPWSIAEMMASLAELLPMPPLTKDQVKLLRTDSVVTSGSKDFVALGLELTALEGVVPTYLSRFRRGGIYADHRHAR